MRHVFFITIFILIASSANAQWTRVFVGTGKPVYDVFFQNNNGNPLVGFFAEGGNIWRTSDGGTTWSKVADVHVGKMYAIVSDFKFKDAMVGWFSCRNNVGGGSGIFRTVDGGITWTQLPTSGYMDGGEGMYYLSKRKVLLVGSWGTGLNESSDDGNTWRNLVSGSSFSFTGIAFSTDESIGFVANANTSAFAYGVYTTDGGLTWSRNSLAAECWQPFCTDGKNTFYGLYEAGGGGPRISTDGGKNWTRRLAYNFSAAASGDLEGSPCKLYAQSYLGYPIGIYRSLDTGKHWENLGGPNTDFFDRRFWAASNHVFAGDSLGNLYHLYDTLGTIVSAVVSLESNSISFDTVDACTDIELPIRFKNVWSCDSIRLVHVDFANGPAIFQIVAPTNSPRWVEPLSSDSILLRFPKTAVGTFTRKLRLTLKFGSYAQDTTIEVTATRLGATLVSTSSRTIDFDTVGLCGSGYRTFTIANTSCDTETVSFDSLGMADFHVETPTSSIVLHPGDSVSVRVRMDGTSLGSRSGFLRIHVEPTVLASNVSSVDFAGVVDRRPTAPLLSALALQFDSTSFCDTSVALMAIALTNPSACDSIGIDSMWITGDVSSFALISGSSNRILPRDSVDAIIVFRSSTKGRHDGVLHIRFADGSTQHDTTIVLSAVTYSGRGQISTPTNILYLGRTTVCASDRDTMIVLRNTGCDTLRIQDASVIGSGFTVDSAFPIVIPPGGLTEVTIHAHFDSSGAATTNVAELTFTSDADNTLAPIVLTQSLGLPNAYRFHLRPVSSMAATAGQSTRFDLVADQLPLPNVRTLDVDISLNADLLEFAGAQGPNAVTESSGHYKIVGTPYIQTTADSAVATLAYTVYLAKDSTSSIALSGMHLNADDSVFEKCYATASLGGSTDTVRYEFNCGEHFIQRLLRSDEIRISSIVPNPVRENVTIEIQSPRSTNAEVEVFDEKGVRVIDRSILLSVGTSSVRLPTAAIASGYYNVRVKTDGGEVSSTFVKAR